MWLFTTFGFFSIVQKQQDEVLTVRARVRADLDRLRERYLPSLSPTVAGAGTDYPYRATALRADVADALRRIAEDIRYANFKLAVTDERGNERAELYHEVWDALCDADAMEPPASESPCEGSLRYGGVIVNEAGDVFLYERRGQLGGYAWTFPRGTAQPGETPERTALRAVEEEIGFSPTIVERLPGKYRDMTSETVYFLMRVVGRPGAVDVEARALRWCSFEDAASLIRETAAPEGCARDLAVLKATSAALARLGMTPGPTASSDSGERTMTGPPSTEGTSSTPAPGRTEQKGGRYLDEKLKRLAAEGKVKIVSGKDGGGIAIVGCRPPPPKKPR